MGTIIAILLYLHLIVSPGSYQKDYVDKIVSDNYSQIDAVRNDPNQMKIVDQDYSGEANNVIIIDPSISK